MHLFLLFSFTLCRASRATLGDSRDHPALTLQNSPLPLHTHRHCRRRPSDNRGKTFYMAAPISPPHPVSPLLVPLTIAGQSILVCTIQPWCTACRMASSPTCIGQGIRDELLSGSILDDARQVHKIYHICRFSMWIANDGFALEQQRILQG